MISFITRTKNQIYTEKRPELQHKLKKLVFLTSSLPIIILAILLVIFIRLIRPFVIIRIDKLDLGRIGGIFKGEWYLSEKKGGGHQGRYLDMFYFIESTNDVNRQWEKMWRHVLPVFPWTNLAQYAERINKWFPGYKEHRIPVSDVLPTREDHIRYLEGKDPTVYAGYTLLLENILSVSQPNISFTEAEDIQGQLELQQIGIPIGKPFICFHNRDSAFLDSVQTERLDATFVNWRYNDYRDSRIQNYLSAAEEMTRRGCYSIRLGAIVKEKLKSGNRKVIDYACNGMRTDFLDIYISAKCYFIIISDTGMSWPAEVFKRPLVFVNFIIPLRNPVYVFPTGFVNRGLMIFKNLYLKNEKRSMTFSEIINLEIGARDTNEILERMNLELIENTPEEIHAVTIEMDERLNDTWKTTKEDEELQERFWSLFGPAKLKNPDLRIGAEYLRQNKDLFN